MTQRATMVPHEFHYRVFVDGVYVGRGNRNECTALMDELNESDEKCDIAKEAI